MNALEKIKKRQHDCSSLLCIGLDIDRAKMPPAIPDTYHGRLTFIKEIIDATKEYALAYKPNCAFYESTGIDGARLLSETCNLVSATGAVLLVDAKRGDIGNTAEHYAHYIFDLLGADATTVNPYMGYDAVKPFLNYSDKLSFILCLTSNPSAADFQFHTSDTPLYLNVAAHAADWNTLHNNCGLVVGATRPDLIENVRIKAPGLPFLIPGIGAQGGDLQTSLAAALNNGTALIAASRSILYASNGNDFAEAARCKAAELHTAINHARS